MSDKARARERHAQHVDELNRLRPLDRHADHVRREEQARAQRRATAVGPWDNTPPKWDPDWFGARL